MSQPTTPPDAGTPPADAQPPANGATTTPPKGSDDAKGADPDPAILLKEKREADREAQRLRNELKRYQDAEKASKDAEMSEVEKLKAEIATLKSGIEERDGKLKAQDLRSAVQAAGAKLGFADPSDAMRYLDAADIEYADDGRPRNIEHLLGDVIRTKPYLKASFNQPPDLGQGDRGKTTGTLTRDQLSKMSQAEVDRLVATDPAAVDAALARP